MSTLGECHLLDVGQGSSNVILLGEGRAIVIDCPQGPHSRSLPTLKLLEHYRVSSVEVLAITHNDSDHDGGAVDILTEYSNRIGKIFLLQDRGLSETRFCKALYTEHERGNLTCQIARLEVEPNGKSKVLWHDTEKELKLVVLYPNCACNFQSQFDGKPNATSAVLVLDTPGGMIVFPGDCEVEGWQAIHAWRKGQKLTCELIAVPHHGGLLGNTLTVDGKNAFQWLYENVLQTKIGVVSVGTYNTYGHPRGEAIAALRQSGATVMCTQITDKCCNDLECVRPGVIEPGQFALSALGPRTTNTGRPKNIACAGSVVAEIRNDGIVIPRLDEHQQAIENHPSLRPLCR